MSNLRPPDPGEGENYFLSPADPSQMMIVHHEETVEAADLSENNIPQGAVGDNPDPDCQNKNNPSSSNSEAQEPMMTNTTYNKRGRDDDNDKVDDPNAKKIPHIDTTEDRTDKLTKNRYASNSLGPFIIYVQSIQNGRNYGEIHPMAIGRMMNQISNGIMEIKRLGKNKVQIELDSATTANRMIENKSLKERNLFAFIPPHKVLRQGLIRQVELGVSDEEIVEAIRESGGNVISAKRKSRRVFEDGKVKYIPTGTVAITFPGQSLPDYIVIYWMKYEVIPFVYPVKMCFHCLRYGHIKNQCRNSMRCARCGLCHEDKCESEKISCYHCKQEHLATDKRCREFQFQKEVKNIMANKNVTAQEANSLLKGPGNSTGYNTVTRESHFPPLRNQHRWSNEKNQNTRVNETRAQAPARSPNNFSNRDSELNKNYRDCLIRPNGRDGPSIKKSHLNVSTSKSYNDPKSPNRESQPSESSSKSNSSDKSTIITDFLKKVVPRFNKNSPNDLNIEEIGKLLLATAEALGSKP